MLDLVDIFGKELAVGQKILYTTNSRDSGMTYAVILDIYTPRDGRYFKVKVRELDDDGNELTQKIHDFHKDSKGNYIRLPDGSFSSDVTDTGKLVRPSILDYAKRKFYIL